MTLRLLTTTLSILVFFFSATLFSTAESAPERILNLESTIVINKDASVDVTENITVATHQEKMLYGIVRRLPVSYRDSYGATHTPHYKIKKILLNQLSAPYHVNQTKDQFEISLGRKDIPLNPDTYTYIIQYHIDDAVSFLANTDEFYWNITGNDWDFRIEKASADVLLPANANIESSSGYIGFMGETGKDFTLQKISPHEMNITSTAPLLPNQSLAMTIAWQKGVVMQPSVADILRSQLETHKSQTILEYLGILIFIYYLITWYWQRKNSHLEKNIPFYTEPPAHLSAAALRYLSLTHYDAKTFITTLISLVAKGAIQIQHHANTLVLTENKSPKIKLYPDEAMIKQILFNTKTTLEWTATNNTIIHQAQMALKDHLKQTLQKAYLVTHTRYLIPAWCLTAVAFVTALLSGTQIISSLYTFATALGGLFFCYVFFIQILHKAPLNKISLPAFCLYGVLLLCLLLPFYILITATHNVALNTLPILFFILVLNYIFKDLLKTTTPKGRSLLKQMTGFKLFLSNMNNQKHTPSSPRKTHALFEKYFPYALALNTETAWSTQFDSLFKKSKTKKPTLTWYTDLTHPTATPLTLVNQLTHFLTNPSDPSDTPSPESSISILDNPTSEETPKSSI